MSTMVTPAYPPADVDARAALLKWVRQTPLRYGPWRTFKALFKQLEADPAPDAEILGAVLSRIDGEPLHSASESPSLKLGDLRQVPQAHLAGDVLTAAGSNRSWGLPNRLTAFRLASDNPLVATAITSKELPATASEIVFAGDRALWVEQATRFLWKLNSLSLDFDVTNVGESTPAVRPPAAIAVSKDFAFVATEHLSNASDRGRSGGSGVRVFSLSDKELQQVADIALENAIKLQVIPERNLLVVQTGSSGFRWGRLPSKSALHLFDISKPAQPREIGKFSSSVSEWIMSSDLLLTTDGDTLTFHSIADGRTVKELARWRYPEAKRNQYRATTLTLPGILGSSVFVGRQYESGWIQLDISNPRVPVVRSEMAVAQDSRVIGQRGDLLYLSQSYSGVSVWDVSTPTSPTRLGAKPSAETLGYLKRRARRLLHRLGKDDPARYVPVVATMLQEASQPMLDLQQQWL